MSPKIFGYFCSSTHLFREKWVEQMCVALSRELNRKTKLFKVLPSQLVTVNSITILSNLLEMFF